MTTTVLETRWAALSAMLRRRPVAAVIAFLVLTQLLLNGAALVAANARPLEEGAKAVAPVQGDPRGFPGVWARWDSGYYLTIATTGYTPNGPEVAFFPGYALAVKALAVGQPALMLWAGYLISTAAFVTAGALLWWLVREDYGKAAAWGTVITLALFPTAFFFSALYAESLFLLLGVLAWRFTARRRYWLAALCVAGASLTRITGALFILIPLVELWVARPPQFARQPSFWRQVVGVSVLGGLGLAALGSYWWVTQGSPVAFMPAHTQFWLRSVVWPWQSVLDSARVALTGYGGNEANWLMRAISAADLLATLLMIGATVLGLFWLRPSLAAYQAAALLFMLMSHGPLSFGLWSMSRVVLGLFPGFIVLGQLATRWPRARWVSRAAWAASFLILLLLTARFAVGAWLA